MSDDKSPPKAAAAPPPKPPAKPEPKHPGMVTVTVDGQEVVVPPGTNMITAAKQVGADIPYYCWHHRLSIAANCRMCLVEVSPGPPKLVPACQTALVEGQQIRTRTAKVAESQRAVMEMLLLNHPVDCAICDQAGECKLQDYYMEHNHRPSRLEGPKVLKHKRKVLGPRVVLDQERCINCTRCVRFMEEVAKEPQLGMFGRGSQERIDVFPGTELDSNYSMNTVDICPVGALLSRDFRFRARAWFLSAAPTICTGCSRGCNVYADFYGQEVYRLRPRENEEINKSWMCDQGRFTYKPLTLGRVLQPVVGRDADAREDTSDVAVRHAWSKLSPLAGTPQLAVAASPTLSNEELLTGLSLAKELLGVKRVFVTGRAKGEADHLLMTEDKNPNRKGLEWIAKGLGLSVEPFESLISEMESGAVKALLALGDPLPDPERFTTAAASLELLVALASNEGALVSRADVVLPLSPHVESEGSFVNMDGIIQRFREIYPPRDSAQPGWKWASDLYAVAEHVTRFDSAREAFAELSSKVPELAGFDWAGAAPPEKNRPGINPLPTGADGRPPGYREGGVLRVRGI